MELYSLGFVLLVAVGLLAYYTVLRRQQWVCLLALSLAFYAVNGWQNLIFLLFTAASCWAGGLWLQKISTEAAAARKDPALDRAAKKALRAAATRKMKGVVALLLLSNFAVLGYFKYFTYLLRAIGRTPLGLLLPFGISFYTFQAVGYVIDCYRGRHPAEKNFAKLLLFLSFFPQMLQGPINRYGQLAAQFTAPHSWQADRCTRAGYRILYGLLKKYAIANLAAPILAGLLDTESSETAGCLVVAGILLYSLQQYADFSGGIDIVMGVAELFDITMAENFRQPYFSTSLGDFWRRWHISLGAWMRDYLFYPFALTAPMQSFGKWAGKRLGKHFGRVLPAAVANLLVFAVVGIWHGPQLHYLAWGLYNGLVIALADLCAPLFERANKALHIPTESRAWHLWRILRTFFIVNIGWYFDRLGLRFSLVYLHNTFFRFEPGAFAAGWQSAAGVVGDLGLPILCVATALVFAVSVLKENGAHPYALVARLPLPLRWAGLYAVIFLVLFSFTCVTGSTGFLYANF